MYKECGFSQKWAWSQKISHVEACTSPQLHYTEIPRSTPELAGFEPLRVLLGLKIIEVIFVVDISLLLGVTDWLQQLKTIHCNVVYRARSFQALVWYAQGAERWV